MFCSILFYKLEAKKFVFKLNFKVNITNFELIHIYLFKQPFFYKQYHVNVSCWNIKCLQNLFWEAIVSTSTQDTRHFCDNLPENYKIDILWDTSTIDTNFYWSGKLDFHIWQIARGEIEKFQAESVS